MKISIGSDHKGYELKGEIINHFSDFEWLDVGTDSTVRANYPVYAKKVCENILNSNVDYGILICGSGIGMSIAANRFNGIYAALCWNTDVAKLAKSDDKANVLVLPAEFISTDDVFVIIKVWIDTEFKGGIYQERLDLVNCDQ